MTPEQAKQFVANENRNWIDEKELTSCEIQLISESYKDEFYPLETHEQLKQKVLTFVNNGKPSLWKQTESQLFIIDENG